jgi:hypothetical protein
MNSQSPVQAAQEVVNSFKLRPPTLDLCLGKTSGSQEFDEIIVGRFTRISFHRTLRIPEDGRNYPLPAGLGRFPIHRVEDYLDKVPAKWLKEGGFFIPLYQKEALFLQFDGPNWHPTIAKVCVGKINSISGKPYSESLSAQSQDYVVIPNQRWLDGICSGEGIVKQFVAMPLGQGYTVEAQVTDEETFGGFKIVVFECEDGRFPERDPDIDKRIREAEFKKKKPWSVTLHSAPLVWGTSPKIVDVSLGIGAGGNLKQQVYKDTYGVQSWSTERKRSLVIHLVNSLAYKEITGIDPPPSPITAAEYQRANIPWYSNYDETAPIVKPPSIFKRILGVSAIEKKRGIAQSNDSEIRYMAKLYIQNIRTPDKSEASTSYRSRAQESRSKEWWDLAIREISYVIDLDVDVTADDFALRSCCNYKIGRFRDGAIDGSLALKKDENCLNALLWRAYCRKSIGEHEALAEDADKLAQIPATELIGLELKAEAYLLAERYDDAFNDAMELRVKCPGNIRARQICIEASKEVFGYEWSGDNEL